MATRALTNILRRSYRWMYRTTATAAAPADLAAWTTMLGTFTELGYTRKGDTVANINKGDTEILDDDKVKTMSYNLELNTSMLQTGASDLTEIDNINGTNVDIMLVDETALRAHVFKNVVIDIFLRIAGGATDTYAVECAKENASSISSILLSFDIPTS